MAFLGRNEMHKTFIVIFYICFAICFCADLGAGTSFLDVKLKDINSGNIILPVEITWSGIVPGVTEWKHADQYLEITYYSDYYGWGIQIFTDNTFIGRNGPPYVYNGAKYLVDPNPSGAPDAGDTIRDFSAGLVHESGKYTLPMCWRVTWPVPFNSEERDTELNIVEVEDEDGDTGWHHLRRSSDTDDGYNCWIHMRDRAFDGWSNPVTIWGRKIPDPDIVWSYETPYILSQTLVCPQGIQGSENTFGWGAGPHPDASPDDPYVVFVYLGAKFDDVAGGDYRTRIYVQIYHF